MAQSQVPIRLRQQTEPATAIAIATAPRNLIGRKRPCFLRRLLRLTPQCSSTMRMILTKPGWLTGKPVTY